MYAHKCGAASQTRPPRTTASDESAGGSSAIAIAVPSGSRGNVSDSGRLSAGSGSPAFAGKAVSEPGAPFASSSQPSSATLGSRTIRSRCRSIAATVAASSMHRATAKSCIPPCTV
eukprot:468483-Prymnesium_polylepis.1